MFIGDKCHLLKSFVLKTQASGMWHKDIGVGDAQGHIVEAVKNIRCTEEEIHRT